MGVDTMGKICILEDAQVQIPLSADYSTMLQPLQILYDPNLIGVWVFPPSLPRSSLLIAFPVLPYIPWQMWNFPTPPSQYPLPCTVVPYPFLTPIVITSALSCPDIVPVPVSHSNSFAIHYDMEYSTAPLYQDS